MYALTAEHPSHVGSTAQRPWKCDGRDLDLPAPRVDQHIRGLLRGDTRQGLHKIRCFAREHLGTVASFVVATGTEPSMRSLERHMLRCLAPTANTTFVYRGPWRAEPVAEHPPGGRGRSRPPSRLRPRARPATIAAWTFIFDGFEAAARRHAEWAAARTCARAGHVRCAR